MNTQCLLLHVFIPLLRENLSRGFGIKEKFVSFFNFVLSDGVFAIDFSEEVGWCEKLDSKSVNSSCTTITNQLLYFKLAK